MPEFLTCFACEQEPTQQCPRCGRPYCDEHGEDVCDACLNPASGLPSFTLYRGSLLVMLVGAALALWLLIQPPGGESNAPQAGTIITPTAQVQVNITAPAGTTPTGSNGSPSPNTTARPNATATPGASGSTGTYTVVSGDSLSSICERVKPASMSVSDCVDQVRSLNGLTGDSISVGQTLRIPQ